MPAEDKPYRVYRGGREKGSVPQPAGEEGRSGRREPVAPAGDGTPPPRRRRRRRFRPGRAIPLLLALVVVLAVVWGVVGYFQLRSGVQDANGRLPREAAAALSPSAPSGVKSILLLGTDHSSLASRQADEHSDSITLLWADSGKHRIAYLTIPRDLRAEIPGYGIGKIGTAYQYGGPALAIKAVQLLTGLPVNRVAIVDFGSFRQLIDEIGGVTIDVPGPILSKFDCPYDAARCASWEGWRFTKGTQHMDGKRALIYSRVRKNALNPADTDISRGQRQQQVLQAVQSKLASVSTYLRLPFVGAGLLKPLSTDLSVDDFLSLAWLAYRTSATRTLHCRLGGDGRVVGGQSMIVGNEDNVAVIQMVTGQSAPQPPRPGGGLFAAGCRVGKHVVPGQ